MNSVKAQLLIKMGIDSKNQQNVCEYVNIRQSLVLFKLIKTTLLCQDSKMMESQKVMKI